MTWTYSANQINTKPLYWVRLELGDNDCGEQQFQDEEILAVISRYGSLYSACAALCRMLSTKYSRSVDFAVTGGGRATYSQLSKQYLRQALSYEVKAAALVSPYFAGISETDKFNQELDQDRVPPVFEKAMHDNQFPVPPIGIESEDIGTD
jgi:hypothetical protein